MTNPRQIRDIALLSQLLDTLADRIADRVAARLSLAQHPTTATDSPDGLLSYAGAAERIGVGETKLRELIGNGQLERVHIGRRALITSASVGEYVASVAGRAVPADDSKIRRIGGRGTAAQVRTTKAARRV